MQQNKLNRPLTARFMAIPPAWVTLEGGCTQANSTLTFSKTVRKRIQTNTQSRRKQGASRQENNEAESAKTRPKRGGKAGRQAKEQMPGELHDQLPHAYTPDVSHSHWKEVSDCFIENVAIYSGNI